MECAIGNIKTIQHLRYVDAFFLLLNSVEANQHKNEIRWLILHERSKKMPIQDHYLSELILFMFQTGFESIRKKIKNNFGNIRLSTQKIHPNKMSTIINNSKKISITFNGKCVKETLNITMYELKRQNRQIIVRNKM